MALHARSSISYRRPATRQLDHVYWIGGDSGAGKSTIARRPAGRFGLRLYDTDALMGVPAQRSPDAAYLRIFTAMDMDERWVNRDPQVMLETFRWYRGEGFERIAEDLQEIHGPVVAEGSGCCRTLWSR